MKSKTKTIFSMGALLTLASLSCGLLGGRASDQPESTADRPLLLMRQWASSATASSEYGNPDWAAYQATGEPDTPECGDLASAWASLDQNTVEWLEVRYETPVIPFEVNIYKSHTPTQVVSVEMLDTSGTYHQVYSAEPSLMADCPYILTIPVDNAEYEVIGVKITVDQSQLGLPWDEIDAVELVGYGDETASNGSDNPEEPSQPLEPGEPAKPAEDSEETSNAASDNWTTYSTGDGLTNEEVHALAVGNDGTVWIASGPFAKQSIVRLKDGVFTNYDLATDGRPVTVTHYGLSVESDGTVWAATGTKLTYFNGNEWESFTKKDGLLDDQTKSVTFSDDGTLWIGSVAGVTRFTEISQDSYTKDDGLVDTFIEAIAIDPQGSAWFVSSFGGVSFFNGKVWTSYRNGNELPDFPHSSIAIGSDGAVWIGSGGGGVSQFDGRDWTTYTVTDEYDLEYVKAIFRAPDGSIWFGTEGHGVFRFDGQNWTNYTKEDGLCYDYVDSIAAAPDGSIWFGCRKNGISRFDP